MFRYLMVSGKVRRDDGFFGMHGTPLYQWLPFVYILWRSLLDDAVDMMCVFHASFSKNCSGEKLGMELFHGLFIKKFI